MLRPTRRAFLGAAVLAALAWAARLEAQTGRAGLTEVGRRFGLNFSWLERGQRARLASRWTKLDFALHKRDFAVNGTKLWLGFPVGEGTSLTLDARDTDASVRPLLRPQDFKPVPALKRIMLDPGHGGRDTGTRSADGKTLEKDLVLRWTGLVKRDLEKAGFTVLTTRADDTFIELADRPALAARAKADLFLSLHFNAATPSAAGLETFALPPRGHPPTSRGAPTAADQQAEPGNRHDAWNLVCGYHLQRHLIRATGAVDRGLRRARFAVLRPLACPGLLVEGGFLSNPGELAKIRTPAYLQKLTDGVVAGVRDYGKVLARQR